MNGPLLRKKFEEFLTEDLGHVEIVDRFYATSKAVILAEEPGIMCGGDLLEELFATLCFNSARPQVTQQVNEGTPFSPGETLVEMTMHPEILRYGIRTALNLLQHLSGIPTNTRKLVDRVRGTGCQLLDSRKTTPGLRVLEKYAVRMGGGHNHRFGMYDGFLLKKEDIAIDGGIKPAIDRALARAPHLTNIEVEVESIVQMMEVLEDGRVKHVLLDNMMPLIIKQAVAKVGNRLVLEASGIKPEQLEEYAATGVPFISTSALVRGGHALNMKMRTV